MSIYDITNLAFSERPQPRWRNFGDDAEKGDPEGIGDTYLATDTEKLYASYDGTTWTEVSNGGGDTIPVGSIFDYAGTTAPSGWLLAYGQAVSRTTYSTLFGVIGTTFGSGDGSTTFNLPDLRGRALAGLDNLGGSSANHVTNAAADSLGGIMGEELHTLTTSEIPAHTHNIAFFNCPGGGGGAITRGTGPTTEYAQTSTSVGSGTSHNNVQPTMFVGKIIKY